MADMEPISQRAKSYIPKYHINIQNKVTYKLIK